jgi:tetratricopeptide (TPR) repeat protein
VPRRPGANRGRAKDVRGSRSRSRIVPLTGAAVIIVALVYVVLMVAPRFASRAPLPPLPESAGRQRSIAEHLRDAYDRAQRDPASAEAVGSLCLALHADLFYDPADQCYARAEGLAPAEWRWTYYRALLQSERGNGEAVAKGMRHVIELMPAFSPAWWWIGDAEFKRSQYDRAEDAWRRAASLPEPDRMTSRPPPHIADIPVSAYASLGLARIALVRGNADLARTVLEPLTASAPRFGPAFRLLADSYVGLSRQADANRARSRADRLPPFAPYADPMVDVLARESRNSTFLLREASEADLAVNAEWSEYLTRRALEFDPDNPEVLSKLGRLLRLFGRSEEALEFFGRYSQIVPDDFQGIGQIGSCLSDLGRFEEAEPFLRRALEGLDDALTHYNLGALLAATGRLDASVAEYRLALERDPEDPDTRGNLAAVLIRQGKLAPATRELARVLELEPDNANAHTNLGLVLAQQGQFENAVREFETALRINPQQRQAADALKALGR